MKLYNLLNDILKDWTKKLHTNINLEYILMVCNDEKFVGVTNNKVIYLIDKEDFLLDFSKTNYGFVGSEKTLDSFLNGKSSERLYFKNIMIDKEHGKVAVFTDTNKEKSVFINNEFIKYFDYENMIIYGSKGDISSSAVFFYEPVKNDLCEDDEILRMIVMPINM